MTARATAWRSLLAAAALCGAGCVSAPPAPPDPVLIGRIAIRVPAHNTEPERGLSASFELQGTADTGVLRLSSPLGTTLAQAQWTPNEARLESAEGPRHFPHLDALTRHMLGEPLPVTALFDWLHGRPWPGANSGPATDPTGFVQLGWHVDLSRFAQGWVQARRTAPPHVFVRARLDNITPSAPDQ